MGGIHAFDRMAELSAGRILRHNPTHHDPEGTPLPGFGEEGLGILVLDGAESVEAAEVVHAVHPSNPTAIASRGFELSDGGARIYGVRAPIRSSVIAGIAFAGVGALAIAPIAPIAPPPEPHAPPPVVRDVELMAAPALGAIPLAFIRNQFQYCSLICTHAVQGAITVPTGAVAAPATFLGSLASTGNVFKAIGSAAVSVTGPADAAVTPLINNDVFLVVPKAFHALDVAIVEAFNVGGTVLTPGGLLQAVQNGRANILDALNRPVGAPTTPTGATNIAQVLAVSAVDVTTAVAFQAGELLLAGVVQIPNAAAQELAQSGDPGAALAAGATRAGQVIGSASAPVVSAVNTAVTNIRDSLADPFPSTAKTVKTDEPKKRKTNDSSESPNVGLEHVSGPKPRHKPTLGAGSPQSSPASSTAADSATDGSSNDSATPSAKKNTTKSGPPR